MKPGRSKNPIINLFIDAEWYLNQRIFLIAFAFENTATGDIEVKQIFRKNILQRHIRKMLDILNGDIYVYGPDVAMIEKRFDIPLREKYRCINFLKVIKHLVPGQSSYKLAEMEKHFGFFRKADKYKTNIFDIYRDWHHPELRKIVLEYNYEDAYYLARLKQVVFKKYKPDDDWLTSIALTAKCIWATVCAYSLQLLFTSL